MSYCGYITKVKDLRKHTNADRLQVATVFGNDVIVGLDVNVDDLMVYFPTDGKLGIEYAKENNLLRISGSNDGGYLDANKRHISSLKLRGEKSDGLLMPLKSLSKFTKVDKLKEGDTITTLNGILICEKYVPKAKVTNQLNTAKNKKKKPKELYPLFEQHLDTSQLAYNTHVFKEGDLVYLTLKLHGTSQRTSHTIKESKTKIHNILHRIGIKLNVKKSWEYISGTRRVTLTNYGGGYYGGNEFRKQWHDFFLDKLPKGISVYYEVVGYVGEGLIMPECDNRKTKDKEFIKEFGNTTRFTYGCGVGQSDIYVYRMTMTNEDGHVVEIPWEIVKIYCDKMGVKYVPELDKFIFTTQEDLLERVRKFENGADPIGNTHVREGIIARIEGKEKFSAFKHKNFTFKCLEGIIKADDILDMEEKESVDEQG